MEWAQNSDSETHLKKKNPTSKTEKSKKYLFLETPCSFNCVCLFLSICCVFVCLFVCLFVVFVCLYEYMNKNPYRAKNKDNWEPSHESAIPGRKIINFDQGSVCK